jgi:Ser/Thr protein kinase RdoA (MazF antagonist)
MTDRSGSRHVVSNFTIQGDVVEMVPYGSGHINDTYRSTVQTAAGVRHYIHQRINQGVFLHPERVMENIERVTTHLQRRIRAAGGNPARDTLNLIPAVDGRSYYRDAVGNYWRTYLFIEGARTHDVARNPDQVYQAARAFGRFQMMMADLPGERLHDTIPNFHNTPHRYAQLQKTVMEDPLNRAGLVRKEIGFAEAHEPDVSVLVDLINSGAISDRIAHNDTKLNNVMFDITTGKGICVIDLDTVMPGLPLYDFGDSIRFSTNPAAEDEKDLSKVLMDIEMFDHFSRGYLEETREFLTPAEIELLSFSATLMALEGGMRFLTDHIEGDVYFKIHRKNHNLDRCRTQFALVADMEKKFDKMTAIVGKYAG